MTTNPTLPQAEAEAIQILSRSSRSIADPAQWLLRSLPDPTASLTEVRWVLDGYLDYHQAAQMMALCADGRGDVKHHCRVESSGKPDTVLYFICLTSDVERVNGQVERVLDGEKVAATMPPKKKIWQLAA
jgi:hypothetical protein